MTGSLNKVMLIGNLGKDPEIKTMQNGEKLANLTLATSEKWRDRDGTTQEKTEWHRVVIFGKPAEIAERYLTKGRKVLIEGQLRTRKWMDSNNVEKYTTEVVVSGFNGNFTILDSNRTGDDRGEDSYSGGHAGGNSGYSGNRNNNNNNKREPFNAPAGDHFDDDIPF